jgi:hypothetical protein
MTKNGLNVILDLKTHAVVLFPQYLQLFDVTQVTPVPKNSVFL